MVWILHNVTDKSYIIFVTHKKRISPNFQIYHCAMILAANLLSVKASISLSPAVVLVEQAASVCAETHPRGRGEISSLCSVMISANSHVAAHKASICSLLRHSIQPQLDSLKRVSSSFTVARESKAFLETQIDYDSVRKCWLSADQITQHQNREKWCKRRVKSVWY